MKHFFGFLFISILKIFVHFDDLLKPNHTNPSKYCTIIIGKNKHFPFIIFCDRQVDCQAGSSEKHKKKKNRMYCPFSLFSITIIISSTFITMW